MPEPQRTTTRPHRVFHLIKGLGRGGAEVLLREALRHGDPQGFTYGFGYFLPWKNHLVPALEAAGAEVTCFEARNAASLFASIPRVARHLRRWDADLIHCHLPLSGVVGRIAGRLTGLPVVYTEHNLMQRYHPLTRRLNCWTWRLQEAVVAVSSEVEQAARQRAGDAVPIHLVRNGVDVDRFRPAPRRGAAQRRELGLPADAPVIGAVAVFRSQKRLDLWLETAARLLGDHPELHFLLVGDGPFMDQVRADAARLGLAEHLHLPGLEADVLPFLAAMDLYLISSRFEGLPIALLEAMAMELPVVATQVGGIPGVIEDGISGLLVPDGDVEALRRAADRLLRAPDARRQMGQAARRRIEDEFSMERMSHELEALYTRILGARRPEDRS